MPLDFAFVLWVGSLILSAGAVVLFLWLMREEREASGVRREAKPETEKADIRSETLPPNA